MRVPGIGPIISSAIGSLCGVQHRSGLILMGPQARDSFYRKIVLRCRAAMMDESKVMDSDELAAERTHDGDQAQPFSRTHQDNQGRWRAR